MAIILLDTSVASLLLPDRARRPELALYRPHIIGNTPALRFQSIAEPWKLAEKRRWGRERRDILDGFLRSFVVIPYDYEPARVWARVCVEAERAGRRLEAGDAWIAATAVHRRIVLLAHDRDFINLPISGLSAISFT
jgi:predicted nucleic acid-binding protein